MSAKLKDNAIDKTKNKKTKHTDFFVEAKKSLSPEMIKKAEDGARKTILQIKLSELRERQGFKQTDIQGFSQPSLSRVENRGDLKLSTLINYVHALGMELEIKARPAQSKKAAFVLYRG